MKLQGSLPQICIRDACEARGLRHPVAGLHLLDVRARRAKVLLQGSIKLILVGGIAHCCIRPRRACDDGHVPAFMCSLKLVATVLAEVQRITHGKVDFNKECVRLKLHAWHWAQAWRIRIAVKGAHALL